MKLLFSILFLYSCFYIKINSLNLEKIRDDILENHNYHRKRHQVDILVRNEEIENMAQKYSEYLASISNLKHSGNNNYGENLYYCFSTFGICLTGEKVSENWYNEIDDYDFNNPGFNNKVGHFTQLVWKGSKEIGCGAACNNKNECFVTCNYYPPGNYLGQFNNNVLPLIESENEDENKDDNEEDENNNEINDNEDENKDNNEEDEVEYKNEDKNGMNTISKVFLTLFIILLIIVIAFVIFHFIIRKKKKGINSLQIIL